MRFVTQISLLCCLILLSMVGAAQAQDTGPTLIEDEADIGFTLDEDWRRWWRRASDRGGRHDPEGPLQQRFPIRQYPTHQSDMATADYPIGDELDWRDTTSGARWWVHSYNAVQLGTNVQMKIGRRMGKNWRYDIRYDRLYTRDTFSDLVQGDFTWQPDEEEGPFIGVSVFPRIEKQDSDMGLTFGYRKKGLGDARLRVWGFDLFASAAYAVAVSRGSPLDYLWQNKSAPLGLALELASVRIGGFRSELYVGGMIPQTRALHTEELSKLSTIDESALMMGGMLEYKLPKIPLWLGTSLMMVESHYQRTNRDAPEESYEAHETNIRGRLYALAVPRRDMRVEAYWRLTSRPEEVTTALDPVAFRRDKGSMLSLRWQWLLARTTGFELSYWRFDRETVGTPDVKVDGSGNRIATRLLWHMHDLTATFGVGWDPANDGYYDGAGGTLRVDF